MLNGCPLRVRNSRRRKVCAECSRPQQDHVSQTSLDQGHSPQNEGAHENFAEFRVASDQGAQIMIAHLQDFAGFRYPPPH